MAHEFKTPLTSIRAATSALLANPDAIEIPADQISCGLVFVAEIGSRVVGFASVLIRSDGVIDLDGLFVEPAAHRRGEDRALVDRCAAFAPP